MGLIPAPAPGTRAQSTWQHRDRPASPLMERPPWPTNRHRGSKIHPSSGHRRRPGAKPGCSALGGQVLIRGCLLCLRPCCATTTAAAGVSPPVEATASSPFDALCAGARASTSSSNGGRLGRRWPFYTAIWSQDLDGLRQMSGGSVTRRCPPSRTPSADRVAPPGRFGPETRRT